MGVSIYESSLVNGSQQKVDFGPFARFILGNCVIITPRLEHIVLIDVYCKFVTQIRVDISQVLANFRKLDTWLGSFK